MELKNWTSSRLDQNLSALISKSVTDSGAEAASELVPGQLINDIVRYEKAGNKGRQLWFTPDVIDGARTRATPFTPDELRQKELEIIGSIKDLIEDDEIEIALNFFGLNIDNSADLVTWNSRKDNLFNSMDGNGDDQSRFVRIFNFDNIVIPQ